MAATSNIEWTDRTWNPTVGCDKVSPGCRGCYAEVMGKRLRAMALADLEAGRNPGRKAAYIEAVDDRGRWTGKVPTLPEALGDPLKWRAPSRIFVNSMSDLFHDDVPFEYVAAVFGVMAACPKHTFQVLTKRPARAGEFFRWIHSDGALTDGTASGDCGDYAFRAGCHFDVAVKSLNRSWPLQNVHVGVSVENQETADARIPLLLQCPAAVRFVSYEPALGPVDFSPFIGYRARVGVRGGVSDNIQDREGRAAPFWLIVGGESGPGARPFDVAWARSTIEQCRAARVACFVKQLGARPEFNGAMGFVSESWKLKDKAGADPSEWPEDLRVQEFPNTPA